MKIQRRDGGRGKAIKLDDFGVWYSEADGFIHVTSKAIEGFHVKVSADPEKPYGHPTLHKRLVECLRRAGAPVPPTASPERKA